MIPTEKIQEVTSAVSKLTEALRIFKTDEETNQILPALVNVCKINSDMLFALMDCYEDLNERVKALETKEDYRGGIK